MASPQMRDAEAPRNPAALLLDERAPERDEDTCPRDWNTNVRGRIIHTRPNPKTEASTKLTGRQHGVRVLGSYPL